MRLKRVVVCVCFLFLGISACAATGQKNSFADASLKSSGFDASKINTLGWSDSPYITPDGKHLFFMYSRYNFMPAILMGMMPKKSGGMREGHHANDDNPYDDSDIYVSDRNIDGSWGVPQAMVTLNDAGGDCCMVFSRNLDMVFYAKHSVENNSQDIVYRTRVDQLPVTQGQWSDIYFLSNDINSTSHEDNPHICEYDDGSLSLWFTSQRPDGLGGKDIWYAEYKGGKWSSASNVGSPINSEENEDQFFMNCRTNEVYFNRNDKIQHTFLDAKNGYLEPEHVDVGHGFAAEASLPDDGQTLYFGSGSILSMSISIMSSHKQADGTWSKGEPVD